MYAIYRALSSVRSSYYSIFLLAVCLISCENDITERIIKQSTLESSIERDFEHIKLDLYSDSSGAIYHRVIDRTSGDERTGIYRYNDYAYASLDNEAGNGYEIIELKELIDAASFIQVDKQDPDGRITYFEDVNHTYFLYSKAEGGVLHARRK